MINTKTFIFREFISNIFILLGTSVIFYLFSTFIIAFLFFSIHQSLSLLTLYISLLTTFIFSALSAKALFVNTTQFYLSLCINLFGLLLIFTTCLNQSGKFIDISYDGQAYQQEGVIQLHNGWNPYFVALTSTHAQWLNHYPRAVWINESILYLLTNNIQSGKAINIIIAISSFLLLYAAISETTTLNWVQKLLISLVFFANPVVIYQSLSFYVDGFLYSLLISLIALGLLVFTTERKFLSFSILAASVILINTKFTGLVDIVVILTFAMFYLYKNSKKIGTFALVSFLTILFGVVIVGFNPYVTNTLNNGNPFYPLAGKNALNTRSENMPTNFVNLNSIEALILSNIAGTQHAVSAESAKLKWPFTVTSDELKVFSTRFAGTNPQEGGFGPLYSGAIVISIFLIILSWSRIEANTKLTLGSLLTIIFVIFCSSAINPLSSVARYVPQMWIIPCVVMLYGILSPSKILKISGYLIMLILLLNSCLIASNYYRYNSKQTMVAKSKLADLAKNTQTQPIYIYFDNFKSNKVLLNTYNIHYYEVFKKDQCLTQSALLPDSISVKCDTFRGTN